MNFLTRSVTFPPKIQEKKERRKASNKKGRVNPGARAQHYLSFLPLRIFYKSSAKGNTVTNLISTISVMPEKMYSAETTAVSL